MRKFFVAMAMSLATVMTASAHTSWSSLSPDKLSECLVQVCFPKLPAEPKLPSECKLLSWPSWPTEPSEPTQG